VQGAVTCSITVTAARFVRRTGRHAATQRTVGRPQPVSGWYNNASVGTGFVAGGQRRVQILQPPARWSAPHDGVAQLHRLFGVERG